MEKEKIIFCWSGGKDCAQALFRLQQEGRYDVVSLLTTVTEGYERISMHGVRVELLERQAAALGIPVDRVYIPQTCVNEIYEKRMEDRLNFWKSRGVRKVAFGDIFLEDLRSYRENNLRKAGMEALFPIWMNDSRLLAQSFISAGFEAVLVCVDTKILDARFSGRRFDAHLLNELPAEVDPCGENGEFHTFVTKGPNFAEPLTVNVGETVVREGYAFTDIY